LQHSTAEIGARVIPSPFELHHPQRGSESENLRTSQRRYR